MDTIYLANHNCIELRSLTNVATEVVDTGATVSVTLKDTAGNEVAGQSWPASMSHVAAGLYRATLDEGLDLTANRKYLAYVDAVGSGGEIGRWELPLLALRRGC